MKRKRRERNYCITLVSSAPWKGISNLFISKGRLSDTSARSILASRSSSCAPTCPNFSKRQGRLRSHINAGQQILALDAAMRRQIQAARAESLRRAAGLLKPPRENGQGPSVFSNREFIGRGSLRRSQCSTPFHGRRSQSTKTSKRYRRQR